MTKLSVLAFLGLGLAVYGQSGKVGVNISSPRATLDIQPNATNSEDDAKTNEGILAPKLSKTRVASIEVPVEGTLVYVIDDANKTNGTINAYTGADPKVAKITEKGYYYYNGTEWVKSAANSLDQEWVYNSSTKNIELKRSGSLSFPNSVFYTKKGEFRNLDPGDKYWFDTFSQTERSVSNSDQLLGDFSRYSLDVKSSNIIVPDSVQPDSWGNIGSKAFSTTTLFDAVPNRMTYYDNLSSGIYLPQFLNNVGSLKNIDAASFNITNNSNNTFIETILSTKNTSIIGKNASSDNLYGSTNLARSYSDKDHKRIIGNVNTAQLYGTNSSKIKIVAGSRNNVVFDNKSNTSVDLLMGQYIMFANLNGSSPKIKRRRRGIYSVF
ncbi:hypothetical protein LEQ04_08030 [Riemerella anatipestifer]|nr:hypothetical protein LEQ04_08030 [Riemerella anatipestifer]